MLRTGRQHRASAIICAGPPQTNTLGAMRRTKIAWILTAIWLVVSISLPLMRATEAAALPLNSWGDYVAGIAAPLAFLWLVVGYFQQGEELRQNTNAIQQQERALLLQAQELKASVEQQKEQVEALNRATYASSFVKIYDILDDEKVIKARNEIYALETVPFEEWTTLADWKTKEQSIKTFLRAHNIAGIIIKHGYLAEEHMVHDWEPHLLRSWKILAKYVEQQRAERGSKNHWKNYESLAQAAARYANGGAQL